MSRPEFSLAYLTAFGTPPARMVEIAAETGYDYVSLRLTPVTDHEPTFPFFTEPSVVADVKAHMADTGISVLDVELIRVGPDDDPADYGRFMEVASDLGARHLIMQLPDPDRSRAAERFAQICRMASPHRMTVDLEFIPWSTTEDLAAAVEIVTKADQSNGGVLIDTLHFARSKSSLADLEMLPEHLFNFVQLCDAPFEAPRTHEGLINAARTARSLPGEAGLDLRPLVEAIPRVPYSLEVPNDIMRKDLGVEEFARRVLRAGQTFLARDEAESAGSGQHR